MEAIKTKNFLTGIPELFIAASKDSSRPTLQGVKLNFRQGVAQATSGFLLAQIPLKVPNELRDFPSVILPQTFADTFKDAKSFESHGLLWGEKMLTVTDEYRTMTFEYLNMTYPDFNSVIPAQRKELTIGLNPELLLLLAQSLGLRHYERGLVLSISLEENGCLSPIRVTTDGDGSRYGYLMPMRISSGKASNVSKSSVDITPTNS